MFFFEELSYVAVNNSGFVSLFFLRFASEIKTAPGCTAKHQQKLMGIN